MRFVADVAHIRHARTWVVAEAAHAGAPADTQRVVGLLASEVVTNAVRHGPADGLVEVEVRTTGDRVRVSVRDGSPRRPVRRDPDPMALSGRGVQLVDRLSAAWGVETDGTGKTVWFEVSMRLSPPGPRGAR